MFWRFRERRYKRFRRHLGEVVQSGNESAARILVETALLKWSLNWEDGSRASMVRDYQELDWYFDRLAGLTQNQIRVGKIERGRQHVNDLVLFLEDDANFKIDGRMMHRAAATKFAKLQMDLKAARNDVINQPEISENTSEEQMHETSD